jgi:hypothetical protein
MTCAKYPPLLSRLLDRELSAQETAELDDHLSRCESCRATLAQWQRQSTHLRDFLGRHALGEKFVRNVLSAVQSKAEPRRSDSEIRDRRRLLLRWLPAAAALLAAALILSLTFTHQPGAVYATVINPGDLEVLHANDWIRTSPGSLLYPGDWLRNPLAGTAEIEWGHALRLTVDPGTLAQIADRSLSVSEEVILLQGSIRSANSAGSHNFQVVTPAGSVVGSAGGFSIGVRDFALPQLRSGTDGSESLSGDVVAIGEASVSNGTARVTGTQASRELIPGEIASFSNSSFVSTPHRSSSVDAALRISGDPAQRSLLSSSLRVKPEGLYITFDAENVSLKKLLEWATGTGVRGGEDIFVAGRLGFPANARPEIVADSVGAALELPITLRRTRAIRQIAGTVESGPPSADRIRGSFRVEKSGNGLISFDFRDIPAGRAFQILKYSLPDLPELSAEAAWFPLTIQVSAQGPEDAKARLMEALKLQCRVMESPTDIIEVASVAAEHATVPSGQKAQPGNSPMGPSQTSDLPPEAVERPTAEPSLPAGIGPEKAASGAELSAFISGLHPAWHIVGGEVWNSGYQASVVTPGNGRTGITAKASPKPHEYYGLDNATPPPKPSVHLIWPPIPDGQAADSPAYSVANAMALAAHAIWYGYSQNGLLVAQIGMWIGPSSNVSVVSSVDLPPLPGPGGHWETLSDIPLVGFAADEPGLDAPLEAERVAAGWSFPAYWCSGLGGRLWIVNPKPEPVVILISILQGETAVWSTTLALPSHGSLLWPESGDAVFRELRRSGPGGQVGIHVLQGVVAAGFAR